MSEAWEVVLLKSGINKNPAKAGGECEMMGRGCVVCVLMDYKMVD